MKVLLVDTGGVNSFAGYMAFLFRMFKDKRILPLRPSLRVPAAAAIALLRSPFIYKKYKKIGGSPLVKGLFEQAEAFSKLSGFAVEPACLYSQPLLEERLKRDRDVHAILTLYPHYSYATVGAVEDRASDIPVVAGYYRNPNFIEAWRKAIAAVYQGEFLLFVVHGLPESFSKRGDPYYRQVLESARLICNALEVAEYRVAFQSRMGPVEWLRPYVEDVIEDLSKEGVDALLVVPISFLNEHLETLYDLDVELRALALSKGFKVYKRVRIPYLSEHLMRCWKEEVEACIR